MVAGASRRATSRRVILAECSRLRRRTSARTWSRRWARHEGWRERARPDADDPDSSSAISRHAKALPLRPSWAISGISWRLQETEHLDNFGVARGMLRNFDAVDFSIWWGWLARTGTLSFAGKIDFKSV